MSDDNISLKNNNAPAENSVLRNFRMELSFDGSSFHGWQIQPNGISVQELVQNKLSKLFGNYPIKLHGSSRTDAGVHALGFAASFKAPESPYIPDWKIKRALNKLLPRDVRILDVNYADEDFHARFSALAKAYTYVINTGDENPFSAKWSWHLPKCGNIENIKQAASFLTGTHDFSAFTVSRSEIDDPVRTIYRIETKFFENFLCITFLGDGFLYKMIRSIMGSLVKTGMDTASPESLKELLASKNRSLGAPTAPPHGLFLVKVFYEENWDDFHIDKPPFQ